MDKNERDKVSDKLQYLAKTDTEYTKEKNECTRREMRIDIQADIALQLTRIAEALEWQAAQALAQARRVCNG